MLARNTANSIPLWGFAVLIWGFWFCAVPVAVFLLGASFGLEELSLKMMGTMSVISGGVLIASYGEVNFKWIVVYMMGGVVGEAFRLIFIELLLKRKGLKMDPITMMYYVSPCRLVITEAFICPGLKSRERSRACLTSVFTVFVFKLSFYWHLIAVTLQCHLPLCTMASIGEA
jgi:hypothetical protein